MDQVLEKKPWIHPCLKCGACCATYRVTFLKAELDGPNNQLAKISKDNGGLWQIMPGTDKRHNPCCNYLKGTIGRSASCGVYESRPSPCKIFKASYEDGVTEAPRCNEARRHHGLKPLTKSDWKKGTPILIATL